MVFVYENALSQKPWRQPVSRQNSRPTSFVGEGTAIVTGYHSSSIRRFDVPPQGILPDDGAGSTACTPMHAFLNETKDAGMEAPHAVADREVTLLEQTSLDPDGFLRFHRRLPFLLLGVEIARAHCAHRMAPEGPVR
jgi:hypothetical protein